MLKKIGIYNDISPELMPQLPKKGTVVTYEFVNVTQDVIPDPNTGARKTILPPSVAIPPTASFYDSVKGNWEKIALITSHDHFGNPKGFRKHYFQPKTMGVYFNIQIGASADMNDLYQYMELAAFVEAEGKPRDENTSIIFRKVNHELQAKKNREQRDLEFKALGAARELKGEDLERVGLLCGYFKSGYDEEVMRDQIESYAKTNPKTFLERLNDEHGDAKATILHALQLEIVEVKDNELCWKDNGASIISLGSHTDPEIQFADFVTADPKGKKVLEMVKNIIKKKKK